jgi:predicted kinase
MTTVVYDSGALIAIDSARSRSAIDRHRKLIEFGGTVLVPTIVAAQVVRRPARQAALMLALRGCELVSFTAAHHVLVGELLARSRTSDVVDAFVALLAAQAQAAIVSTDAGDIGHLLSCLGVRRPVLQF